jgi:hypothetical protein
LPGPRSAISQRAAFARGERRRGADREGVGGGGDFRFAFLRFAFRVGDGEVVTAVASDDLQAAAARRVGVERHVGGADRGRFLAAGDQRRAALAAVGALATVQRVAPTAADDRVVAGPADDHVRVLVADQRVAEGGAFDRLEAEEPVVAVAESLVIRQRDPDAAAFLPRDRGREGGDVARAGTPVHAVVAVVAADDVFVAGAAVDGVDAEPAADFVLVSRSAGEVVVAEVAEDAVGTGAAFDPVVAAAAVDQVVAGAAADDVVAEPAVDLVVARPAPDHVGLFGALDDVVAGGADDRRAVPVAHRRGAVFGARSGDREERGEREPEQEGGGDPSRHGRHSGGAGGVVLPGTVPGIDTESII